MIDNQESLQKALCKNWGLVNEPSPQMEDLKRALGSKIRELLENDFHALVQAMYRLDVNEGKFHEAMAAPGLDEQTRTLTDLIIEREIQRIEFRNKYRSN